MTSDTDHPPYTFIEPILESEPSGWNAIRQLPDSSAMFGDYLLEWYARVEPADRPFLKQILDAFS